MRRVQACRCLFRPEEALESMQLKTGGDSKLIYTQKPIEAQEFPYSLLPIRLVVKICAFHAHDPGSIPGWGGTLFAAVTAAPALGVGQALFVPSQQRFDFPLLPPS